MPILDPVKKTIAQNARLYKKICRDCGGTNAATATSVASATVRTCDGRNANS
jgi:ribosomal protein L40E